jgi:predicted nucleic acid-binding protein
MLLVDASEDLLRAAAALTSATVPTLDAIHLASAIRIDPGEFAVYDRRLAAAATEAGLPVASPGASIAP